MNSPTFSVNSLFVCKKTDKELSNSTYWSSWISKMLGVLLLKTFFQCFIGFTPSTFLKKMLP